MVVKNPQIFAVAMQRNFYTRNFNRTYIDIHNVCPTMNFLRVQRGWSLFVRVQEVGIGMHDA